MNKDLFKNSILKINENFWEVKGLPEGEYDAQAVQYDKLISNGLYNRIMWGNSPQDYTDFCKQGLKNNNGGIIADIGCGTLSFTYKAYSEYHNKDIFLCDLSNEMLNIGKNRIEQINDNNSSIIFLRSDALNMPFKDNTVQTILNFGLLHIFDNPSLLLNEFVRILRPDGQLYLTCLCTDRKLSAKYLKLLYKKGHVAKPLKSTEIRNIIEKSGIKIDTFEIKGGMAYVSGIKNNYPQN